jgi:hypothetical protein
VYITSPLIRGCYIFDKSKVSQKTLQQVFYDKQNPFSGEIYAFFAYPRRAFVAHQVDKKMEAITIIEKRDISVNILGRGYNEDGEEKFSSNPTSSYALNVLLETEYGTRIWKMMRAWPLRNTEDIGKYYQGTIPVSDLAAKILPLLDQYLRFTVNIDQEFVQYAGSATAATLNLCRQKVEELAKSTSNSMMDVERLHKEEADFTLASSIGAMKSMADFSLQQAGSVILSSLSGT